ncbi:zinc finger, c4 type (two domains) domain-containing protein [Ditylenchus destructor]|uniref:Zinc finger, c4 type (Two domains) domain-containing protein n=1 Tax=Ditylenchus destructor TaxID=166010 RepID=A0AAD4NHS6_9BILA|nr:zinc finger, c4 type (two domains) domain-containing protein [Ditylenchus destructor]
MNNCKSALPDVQGEQPKESKPLCVICGDTSECQRFGADACRACGAFFKRSLSGPQPAKYRCRLSQKCEIDKETRSNCRWCRFQKCLEAGMNISKNEDDQSSACPKTVTNETERITLADGYAIPNKADKIKIMRECMEITSRRQLVGFEYEFPILERVHMAYQRLQTRRDELNDRCEGGKRNFTKRKFELTEYIRTIPQEVRFVAEMLAAVQGFSELTEIDRTLLLKRFWTKFVVFERAYDTYRVLDPNASNLEIIFPQGAIVDAIDGVVISGLINNEASSIYKPWWLATARELVPLFNRMRPTDIEISFCFILLIYNASDISTQISQGGGTFVAAILKSVYKELNDYYNNSFGKEDSTPVNIVERVVELLNLISTAEKILADRQERKLMDSVFSMFKKGVPFDDIFDPDA